MTTRPFPRPSVNAVIPCAHISLMETQLEIVFQGVLRLDQCARRHLQPIDESGQQKPQRGAATQYWQCRNLAPLELALAHVAVEQSASLGDVVGMVRLETPRVEADRDIIGEGIRTGEIEIDQTRHAVAKKKDVIRKQVSVNDTLRKVTRPIAFELRKFTLDRGTESLLHCIGARAGRIKQRPP